MTKTQMGNLMENIENIENMTPLSLKGDFSGLYKLKAGDWRIIYDIDHKKKVVTVHKIGHRKEIV